MTDAPESPEPPDPSTLDPLLEVWPSGTDLWRVHKIKRRPAEFNPGLDRGRFHPFQGSDGTPVSTLYAAATWEGAICETLFRDVPLRGSDRRKARAELEIRAMSRVRLAREVSLIDLRTLGLRRIQLHRRELIDTEADQYPRTARWARALYQAAPAAAGLLWIARLADPPAMVFFGDRVTEKDFSVLEGPIPLAVGKGLAMVMELAEKAKILITD
ncbi:MAG: RES family NAD+ phosphorylase [Thermoanaerobaculia bacterium]